MSKLRKSIYWVWYVLFWVGIGAWLAGCAVAMCQPTTVQSIHLGAGDALGEAIFQSYVLQTAEQE